MNIVTKLLVWFVIGLVTIAALKVAVPLVATAFGLAIALALAAIPILLVGGAVYLLLRWAGGAGGTV